MKALGVGRLAQGDSPDLTPNAECLTPLVSVLMLAYNHERFIAQAIESVLAQETPFPIELVIAEDASTDKTGQIVAEFARNHPDCVKPIFATRNQGWRKNFNTALAECRGEFVALLEGDDYWTSPYKLRLQVERLRHEPACSLCFTRVDKVDEQGDFIASMPGSPVKPVSALRDIVARQFVQTCSVMFRRSSFAGMPEWFSDLKLGDWPVWILISQRGKLAFVDETTAAYRVHGGGIWSGSDPVTMCREVIRMFEALQRRVERRHRHLIKRAISREYFELSWLMRDRGKHHWARRAIGRCVRACPFNPDLSLGRVLMMWLRYHAPLIHRAASVFQR